MVPLPILEAAMDNRVNEIRRTIRALRADMLAMEEAVRVQMNRDHDCTEPALRLLAMRREMAVLARELTILGGTDRLPTVDERLKENHRPTPKPKVLATRAAISPASQGHARHPHHRRESRRVDACAVG